MNLVSDQWIPVLNANGQSQQISLREVFCQGAHWRDLAVRPHERVALMRLLLCIAHAALNGPSQEDWPRVPDLLPDAATAYLEKWQDSFDLFHPQKPFLQIAGLKALTKKAQQGDNGEGSFVSASKLDFSLATGENSTFFDHEGSLAQRSALPLSPALNLLTYLCFSPGGLIGAVDWKGHVTERSSSDGPCIVGSMTHTFWRGANLFQTLQLNMCRRSDIEQRLASISAAGWGKPVWEQMPVSMDDADAWRNATQTYLGRLAPLSRLVLFQRDASAVILGAGAVFPNFNSEKAPFVEEPTATIINRGDNKKQTRVLLGAMSDKALWRELHALVAHRDKDNVGGFWAAQINYPVDAIDRDLVVSCTERKPGQAEILNIVESVYNVKKELQHDYGQMLYRELAGFAKKVENILDESFKEYYKSMGQSLSKSSKSKRGKVMYWTAVEQNLPLLFACVESLGSDALPAAQKEWKKALFIAARKAYAATCAPQTPRQHRAYALGLAMLGKSANEANSPNTPSETSSDTSHEEDDK